MHSLVNAATGIICIVLGVGITRFSSISRRIVMELGLILLLWGVGNSLTSLFPAVLMGMISSETIIFDVAGIALTLSLFYLAYSLLKCGALHSRYTFLALGLASLSILIYSGQYDALINVLYVGLRLDPFWLSYFLYPLSLIVAFTAFSVASWRGFSLHGFKDTKMFSALQAAVLIYGAGWLLLVVDEDITRYQAIVQASSGYLGTPLYPVVTLLWPLLDFLFALSILFIGLNMRGLQLKLESKGACS
jgi:hypothetical protein